VYEMVSDAEILKVILRGNSKLLFAADIDEFSAMHDKRLDHRIEVREHGGNRKLHVLVLQIPGKKLADTGLPTESARKRMR